MRRPTPARRAVTLGLLSFLLAGAVLAQERTHNPRLRTFSGGDLGTILPLAGFDGNDRSAQAEAFRAAAVNFAADYARLRLQAAGDEELVPVRVGTDKLGLAQTRFEQRIDGKRVYGANLVVHSDAATGVVRVVNGEFVPSTGLPRGAAIGAAAALDFALATLGTRTARAVDQAELCYVIAQANEQIRLAWRQKYRYVVRGELRIDHLFADAANGALVARYPTIHTAKQRTTYTANNGTGLPGTVLCTNDQPCGGDAVAQKAHDNAGATYDYYFTKFSRDSINNAGLNLRSTVHYGNNYNNAFWNGQQMVYGDGDGSVFSPLGGALDVVAHELTHGVTENESGLIYQNESGALNEALSDVFGAAAEAWVDGSISADTWKLGEEIYTPNTAGDALRYMNHPTQDGQSRDYYPERYTGTGDNGGVHINSGIANLAFYLLVQGGQHPRGKTTTVVPAIGLLKAEAIFYRANTNYLTTSSNFQAMRNATAQAAGDLYGQADADAVQLGWCAVGVPGCPTEPGPPTEALQNNLPRTNLSGAQGSERFFTFEVPGGATLLTVKTSGGSGDLDLYVRRGTPPTTSAYDCRPYTNGNTETCTFNNPQAGVWHIMLRGYSAYAGATIVAQYTSGGGPPSDVVVLEKGVPKTGLAGAQGSESFFKIAVPAGATNLTFTISGGTGDADLYVRRGSKPTTALYDCRPYKSTNAESCSFAAPAAGDWYVMIRGYRAYAGVSLVANYQTGGACTPSSGSVPNLSGATGSEQRYFVDVPACATSFSAAISGGSGDADLYVRFGSQPTTSTYDCRPYLGSNNESCTFAPPQAGRYHIMIRGYRAYSGVTLQTNYQ